MAQSIWLFPIVESVHVLGLCIFLGIAVLLDLRLLGWCFSTTPVSRVAARLFPWIVGGFAIMVVSGALTFLNAPVRYYSNIFFRIKFLALLLAGANAWVFHKTTFRTVDSWDDHPVTPRAARLAGGASLALWAVVVVAGRMIAYNWFDK